MSPRYLPRSYHLWFCLLVSFSCQQSHISGFSTRRQNKNLQHRIHVKMTNQNQEHSNLQTTTTSSSSSTTTTSPELISKNLQAVIFDIDGTLVDSWKLGYDATQVVLQNHDISPISIETYHECTKYTTPERLARHAGLLPDVDDEFVLVGNRLAKEFDELYVGLVTTKTAGYFPGIEQVIERIINHDRSMKVGCLTNACVAYAHAVLQVNFAVQSIKDIEIDETHNADSQRQQIALHFQSIHGADTVPKPKPNPDGLYQICNELDVDPKNAIYIGDSPSDAIAADTAGMPSIGVTWGSHSIESLRNAPFTTICTNVKELYDLLGV